MRVQIFRPDWYTDHATAPMIQLRFALIGAGFWSRFQLSGWREAGGVECVGAYNRTRSKVESLAREFQILSVFDDSVTMLRETRPPFVDVVTGVETEVEYTLLGASLGIPIMCQRPLSETYADATAMVAACSAAKVSRHAKEKWRWQAPIREFASRADAAGIGKTFRAQIRMVSGFRLFAKPADLAGSRQHPGEDVATVILKMESGATVTVEMGYAGNFLEQSRFPEATIFIEAANGSAELTLDFWIRITDSRGTHIQRWPPPRCAWADPRCDVVHSSIVPCQANLLAAMRGECAAATSGDDNLKTTRLVFGAYESAASGEVRRSKH